MEIAKTMRPFSAACERNKEPILMRLQQYLNRPATVLEIGSGSGQHGEYFAQMLPQIIWQCSDQPCYLNDLTARVTQANLNNLPAPIELDINQCDWSVGCFDAVFSANTLHIMSASTMETFLTNIHRVLVKSGQLFLYGPFKYQGKFTSDSNAQFDQSLRQKNHESAIRDFETIDQLLNKNGFKLQRDDAMPANNQLLHYQLF